MFCSGLTPEQALELEPFPNWFVPGKGQLARARGDQTERVSDKRVCAVAANVASIGLLINSIAKKGRSLAAGANNAHQPL